jgi:hypothetical protein
MTIYELKTDSIHQLTETSYAQQGILERDDLQRLLRDQIDVVSPDSMVIYEEFGDWDDSKRRIDLLCVDRDANLVVVELKRTQDGGHMELQALRYAAMVSTMTLGKAVEYFGKYLKQRDISEDAEEVILDFLGWDEPDEDRFAQDVRIVLASAEFSKELTSSILWLNQRDLDIRCVRLKPYQMEDRILIDAQQVIPLPETEEFQIQIKEKAKAERATKGTQWDEQSFIADLKKHEGERGVKVIRELWEWIRPWSPEPWWGYAKNYGTAISIPKINGQKYHLFRVRSDGLIVYQFDTLQSRPEFSDDSARQAIFDMAQNISDFDGGKNTINGRPRFPIKSLHNPENLKIFKSTIEMMLERIEEPHK